MQFSDEELIAYLLGDATDELSARLRLQLPHEPQLLERLNEFRVMLGLIDSLAENFEPPAGLVDGTLARIDAAANASDASDESADAEESAAPVLLSPRSDPLSRRSALWDSTALTISLTILCCLALPALVRVRFESRKAQCAHNLTLTGSELVEYALNQPGQRFPRVALTGPEAFAGVYAVYLRDSGAELHPGQLQCASLQGMPGSPPELAATIPSASATIPSLAQLRKLAVQELQHWQQVIGGDYAYNLGVAEQGSVRAPKCQGRSQFAILADAPMLAPTAGQSELPLQYSEEFVAHAGKGINVFYEDGRVVFISTASLTQPQAAGGLLVDHPLRNQHGAHEVGLHPADASLAPSHFPPLRR